MFSPYEMLLDGSWGYLSVFTSADYIHGAPWHIRLNPLRWRLGIGKDRPCTIVIKGPMYR